MKSIKVWDIQTRLFHWGLVLFTLCSFVVADMPERFGMKTVNSDVWLGFHIATGTAVLLLMAFRIFWGFTGSFHSRFSSFSLSGLFHYLRSALRGRLLLYAGHNPGASWAALGIFVTASLAALTGGLLFGLDEGRGLLRELYYQYHPYAEAAKLAHYGISFILLGIIAVHFSGVIMETVRHKTGVIRAMVTGKKWSDEEERESRIHPLVSVTSFALLLLPLPLTWIIYTNISNHRPQLTAVPAFYKKDCGDCHMAYPPNILPARSWKAVMAGLNDHFGEDATLDEATAAGIEKYLVANSAERSLEEAAIKLRASIPEGQAPISVTSVGYWKNKHRGLRPEVYKRESVKSKSNCAACHKWAEYGSFEDSDIRIPRS